MQPLQNHVDVPLVSAIIVTYEGDIELLPRAFASVQAQDLPEGQLEVLIFHDGVPSERGNEVLDSLKADRFPARVHWMEEKIGYYCIARNHGTTLAKGFYVANLDADNEWRSGHLRGLLEAIREPDPEDAWPHFVYSRREYVDDRRVEVASMPETYLKLPVGPSPLVPWNAETLGMLVRAPKYNFIDTGDFLISRGALYELAERSGCIWNPQCRRFGDYDLVCRMARSGIRGRAVDQVSHVYHWTGENLQVTRSLSEIDAVPVSVYNRLRARGLIREN